jgi:chromosomal replication initiator protein
MKEDRATGMSASHGCSDDMALVESFKEALKQRVGVDRFRMWFTHGVSFKIDDAIADSVTIATDSPDSFTSGSRVFPRQSVVVSVRGAFALDRLKKNYLKELRGAAMAACGSSLDIRFVLENEPAVQASLLDEDGSDAATTKQTSNPQRGSARSMSSVLSTGETARSQSRRSSLTPRFNQPAQLTLELDTQDTAKESPTDVASRDVAPKVHSSGMTIAEFIPGSCNQLASAAANMVCQNPSSASPLFLFGSTGVGKTHLLNAIAHQFRRYHRMRTVMVLTAEQFTNDFITSVSATGLPAFRRRYREVDALLVDDVQFLESKRATLREMLFTVETLAAAGRPLVFTANQSPSEIPGLTRELAGRMASGLVCPMQPLDSATRKQLLMRLINKSCPLAWPEETIDEINLMLSGDARMSSGVVNLVGMLQRMYQRMPTM